MPPNNNANEDYDPYRDPDSPFYDPYADPDSPLYDPYLDPDAPWDDPDWNPPPEPNGSNNGETGDDEDLEKGDCTKERLQPDVCLECCTMLDKYGNVRKIKCEIIDCPGYV